MPRSLKICLLGETLILASGISLGLEAGEKRRFGPLKTRRRMGEVLADARVCGGF
jgi:hypothetical protein